MALKQLSKQLVLYFVLGGLLTLVEWLGFWVLVCVWSALSHRQHLAFRGFRAAWNDSV